MNTSRRKTLLSLAVGILAGGLVLQSIGKHIAVTWLRRHSTLRTMQSPPGGRYGVAVYGYPRLADIPECVGFGQGYVHVYELSTGRVLQEKVAEDLGGIHLFAWGPTNVTISGFAEWQVPGWYQAPN